MSNPGFKLQGTHTTLKVERSEATKVRQSKAVRRNVATQIFCALVIANANKTAEGYLLDRAFELADRLIKRV